LPARDERAARTLWEVSRKLTGIAFAGLFRETGVGERQGNGGGTQSQDVVRNELPKMPIAGIKR